MAGIKHPATPDGRYFIVKGKLWRLSNPEVEPRKRARLVQILMDERRAVKSAKIAGNRNAEFEAYRQVDDAKRALGERGPVWWDDGAPDFDRSRKEHAMRRMVLETAIGLIHRDAAATPQSSER